MDGKIKTIIEYDSHADSGIALARFNFKYDTITGFLNSVVIDGKNDGVYYDSVSSFAISKINDSKLNILAFFNFLPRYFTAIANNNQIVSFIETDSAGLNEDNITTAYTTNTILDSIYDKGYAPLLMTNIKVNNINYENNNCKSYHYSWNSDFPYYNKIIDGHKFFTYTTMLNDNVLPYQSPLYDLGGSITTFLGYYLNLNNFNIIKPNNNLIDSIINGASVTKYSYEKLNDKVSKIVRFQYNKESSVYYYCNIEYY